MTGEQARTYLRQRLSNLDHKYRDHWPRWTNADYAAVGILLGQLSELDRLHQEIANMEVKALYD